MSPTITQNLETEFDLERAFFNQHGKDHRYIALQGQWRIWNGQYWAKDETLLTFSKVKSVCADAADDVYYPQTRQRSPASKIALTCSRLAIRRRSASSIKMSVVGSPIARSFSP